MVPKFLTVTSSPLVATISAFAKPSLSQGIQMDDLASKACCSLSNAFLSTCSHCKIKVYFVDTHVDLWLGYLGSFGFNFNNFDQIYPQIDEWN